MIKTILHIAESAYGGGAETVFRDTIYSLKKYDSGFRHLVACKNHPSLPFEVDLCFPDNYNSGFSLLLSQIYSSGNYRLLKNFLMANKPDIIHLQNFGNLSPSILRALFEYRNANPGIKIIQTVHTFEYICSHYAAYDYRQKRRCIDCAGSTYKLKIFYRGCSRGGYLHSVGKGITSLIANFYINKNVIDKWITPSEFLMEMMSQFRFEKKKIISIKNPLSDLFLNSPPTDQQTQKDSNTIAYFGRLSEEKNLEVLLYAFKNIVEKNNLSVLNIIGNGSSKNALLKLAVELNLEDNINFIDFVPQKELRKILNEVKIAVLPSKCFETASMLVFESVISGVVPIVANHGGMKEMVEWLNCGLIFEGNDSNDLQEKIEWVLHNYNDYVNVINLAQEKLKTDLSLEKYSHQLTNQYQNL